MIAPYYSDDAVTVHLGKAERVLRDLPDASVDAIVTDPPAAVAFMGREWDSDRGGRDKWVAWLTEVLTEATRCLKPGGHALIWALPRTSHWTAWAIEDAGLDIRDCVLHLFGSGFPKSLDVARAITKATRPAEQPVGVSAPDAGTLARFDQLGPDLQVTAGTWLVTDPAAPSPETVQWRGWGTALKPGQEIWWLARKPFKGAVAGNVLEHGTGALNIDACRIPPTGAYEPNAGKTKGRGLGYHGGVAPRPQWDGSVGRWPTNVVFTHSAACIEDGPCAQGGTITRRVYSDGRGDVVLESSVECLLNRLQALLADLRASSRNGTNLWPGAFEFYRSQDSRSSEGDGERALRGAVECVLGESAVQDSLGGCQSCRDSDGARVRRVLDVCPGGLPSLLDALGDEIRQVAQDARSRGRRHPAPQSNSDAPPVAEHASCRCPSSTSDECPCQSNEGGTPSRTPGRQSAVLRRDVPGGSSLPSSTASPCDSSGSLDHSDCTYATARLLTLLAFDLASRFITPNPGVYARDVAFSLPSCPVAELDRQSGVRTSGTGAVKRASAKGGPPSASIGAESRAVGTEMISYGDSGGASRYFPVFRYEAKASAAERPRLPDGTAWPTVKPLALMRWLVRLITPPGGLVLDPFAGSGTTGEACVIEGFRCLLIDQDPQAAELIKTRLGKPIQPSLGFEEGIA